MPRKKPDAELVPAQLDGKIHVVRGVRVMLDSDLAELYRVPTSALNQAVERNRQRFPSDFSFLLTGEEFANLISQIVISNTGRGGRRKLPRVFTEQGVAMLSGVLRSETAVRVNIEIMRAFVRMRRLLATPGDIVMQLQQLAEAVKLHDKQIAAISELLHKMLEPPPVPANRPIGFHVHQQSTPEAAI